MLALRADTPERSAPKIGGARSGNFGDRLPDQPPQIRRPRSGGHRRLTVGVARTTTLHPARTTRPRRRGRAVDVELLDHVVANLAGDAPDERGGEEAQLGSPRRRLGLHSQLAVGQLDRPAVCGDVRPDHLLPGTEHSGFGGRLLPTSGFDQPIQHNAEELRIPRIRPRPGVPAQPPPRRATLPAGSAGAPPRRLGSPSRQRRVEHGPSQLRPDQPFPHTFAQPRRPLLPSGLRLRTGPLLARRMTRRLTALPRIPRRTSTARRRFPRRGSTTAGRRIPRRGSTAGRRPSTAAERCILRRSGTTARRRIPRRGSAAGRRTSTTSGRCIPTASSAAGRRASRGGTALSGRGRARRRPGAGDRRRFRTHRVAACLAVWRGPPRCCATRSRTPRHFAGLFLGARLCGAPPTLGAVGYRARQLLASGPVGALSRTGKALRRLPLLRGPASCRAGRRDATARRAAPWRRVVR